MASSGDEGSGDPQRTDKRLKFLSQVNPAESQLAGANESATPTNKENDAMQVNQFREPAKQVDLELVVLGMGAGVRMVPDGENVVGGATASRLEPLKGRLLSANYDYRKMGERIQDSGLDEADLIPDYDKGFCGGVAQLWGIADFNVAPSKCTVSLLLELIAAMKKVIKRIPGISES